MSRDKKALRTFIESATEPHVIKNARLSWKCFSTSFIEWCHQYDMETDGATQLFETVPVLHHNSPQFEMYRTQIGMRLSEFLATSESDNDNIYTFSYKDLKECPDQCKEGVSFSDLGFPDEEVTDMTFWLGSKNAHTSCHYDTYGYNIVVQVFGRKMWLLFPPDAKLTPSRVPYEESSVYSLETFYSPSNENSYSEISNSCHKVILEPGDVLIVPAKWWHYVENLEPAMSINTWIHIKQDYKERIKECIVKQNILTMMQFVPDRLREYYVNPNELDMFTSPKEDIMHEILNILYILCNDPDKLTVSGPLNSDKKSKDRKNSKEYEALLKRTRSANPKLSIEKVPCISKNSFKEMIRKHSGRHAEQSNTLLKHDDSIEFYQYRSLINAHCHNNVVEQIMYHYIKNNFHAGASNT